MIRFPSRSVKTVGTSCATTIAMSAGLIALPLRPYTGVISTASA